MTMRKHFTLNTKDSIRSMINKFKCKDRANKKTHKTQKMLIYMKEVKVLQNS